MEQHDRAGIFMTVVFCIALVYIASSIGCGSHTHAKDQPDPPAATLVLRERDMIGNWTMTLSGRDYDTTLGTGGNYTSMVGAAEWFGSWMITDDRLRIYECSKSSLGFGMPSWILWEIDLTKDVSGQFMLDDLRGQDDHNRAPFRLLRK